VSVALVIQIERPHQAAQSLAGAAFPASQLVRADRHEQKHFINN
jgi:hypothetical protein